MSLFIRVPLLFENLVGSVIPKNSFSFILRRFILKSSAIITSHFVLSKDETIVVNSLKHSL